ncbi:MAG TPA: beta-ketoacyl-ACP synthase III [Terriglobia bacterium]|nr:beta-ketoacyl-ACP synthase III [Terriglobia bacterium]
MNLRRTKITAVSHYLPDRRVTNKDFEKTLDTSDQWIFERTGIRERRFVEKGVATSDLAAAASKILLKQRGIDASEIDLIIVGTVTPDMFFPSTACLVQKKIGAKNAWGFDLSGACSGYIYSLVTGAQFISTGACNKVLVIGADVMTSIVDPEDRTTCVLFGDGAGATLLEPAGNNERGIIDFIMKSDGTGGQYLHMPAGGSLNPASVETVKKKMHYVHQDGKNVFKYAVRGMADVSHEILVKNSINPIDVKLYIPHQANLRIIQAAVDRMNLEPSRVAINIDRFANTTAATIPICISEAAENKSVNKGDLVLLASFGAGFTWGSLLFSWEM